MIRFVLDPNRVVCPDLAAKLPGRGMWLSARADVLETALERDKKGKGGLARAFARASRGVDNAGPVTLPADLPGVLADGLKRRISEHIGLARRAGQTVAGFAKARDWLTTGKASVVLAAADGSLDERRRLMSGVTRLTVLWPLTAAELGQIFGRDHAVHVAVAPGRIAQALEIDIDRLAGLTRQVLKQQAGE